MSKLSAVHLCSVFSNKQDVNFLLTDRMIQADANVYIKDIT